MCLVINQTRTDEVKAQPNYTVKRWKVLLWRKDQQCWQSVHYPCHHWKIGDNQAVINEALNTTTIQNSGIHVFVRRYDALSDMGWYNNAYIVQVECELADLIAVGNHSDTHEEQEVYTKVTVKEFPQIRE